MDNFGYSSDPLDSVEKNAPLKNSTKESTTRAHHHNFRSTLAQCFATFVHSLSILTVGLLLTISTVIIGSVHTPRGPKFSEDSGLLHLNKEQVSWYASLVPLSQPLGYFLGEFLQNYIGRRRGVFFTYILSATTWIVLYKVTSVQGLYVSSVLAGISVGLNDAPGMAYVGEIATPQLRRVLVMYSINNLAIGNMVMFLLASFISWKTLPLVCLGWLLFSLTLLGMIPDSPIWLINHGRTKEALEALQWLRGWVPEADVLHEFEELRQFIESAKSSNSMVNDSNESKSSWKEKFKTIKHLFEGSTLRPFVFLICTWFFVLHGTLVTVRSYAIPILDGLNLPVNSSLLACFFSLVSPIGGISGALLMKILGKRMVAFSAIILSSIVSTLMGLYIEFQHEIARPWIYMTLYIVLGSCSLCAINMPWILMGEIYPTKTKSLAIGITTTVMLICSSFYIKTYYYLQRWMKTQTIYISYGILGIVGFFYLWIFMPETEGKTTTEMEELFADNARKLCPHFRKKKK